MRGYTERRMMEEMYDRDGCAFIAFTWREADEIERLWKAADGFKADCNMVDASCDSCRFGEVCEAVEALRDLFGETP